MKYNTSDYVGKDIQLYPGDYTVKYGTIKNVDDLGWTILITKLGGPYHYEVGDTIFISHATNFNFKFI